MRTAYTPGSTDSSSVPSATPSAMIDSMRRPERCHVLIEVCSGLSGERAAKIGNRVTVVRRCDRVPDEKVQLRLGGRGRLEEFRQMGKPDRVVLLDPAITICSTSLKWL